MTYDVQAKRTGRFRKLLKRYLNHEQYSVFTGDLTQAQLIKLRRELSQLMITEDRVTEICAKNRHNVDVSHLLKADNGKGELSVQPHDEHKRDFNVL